MNTRLRITAGMLAIAAVATWGTWRLSQRAAVLDVEKTALTRQLAELRERRAQLSQRRRLADMPDERGRTPAAQPKGREPAPAKPSWLELIRTDPKVQNLYLEYERTEVLLEYGPLLRRLRLSSEQLQKFVDNAARNRADNLDLRSAALAKGVSTDDASIETLQRQQRDRYEAEQRELLGDERFGILTAYEHDQGVREMVHGILGQAVLNDVAFTPEQVPQLVAALLAAEGDGVTDWHKFDERAATFLTPQQLEFLQTHEAGGPRGFGWRFQAQLNDLITKGDEADRAAGKPVVAAPSG